MVFRDARIPVRLGWSSPFARRQGPLAELSSIGLVADVTTRTLHDRCGYAAAINLVMRGPLTAYRRRGLRPLSIGDQVQLAMERAQAFYEALGWHLDGGVGPRQARAGTALRGVWTEAGISRRRCRGPWAS
jgi:hypothetical protein